jgi:prepilin-type N-terminal cleavage/methylation domain-containing protein
MKLYKKGFTLVELLVVIVVIAILAGLVIVGYTPTQIRTAKAVAQKEIEQARSKLELHNGIERDYPPNFANIEYSAPEKVAMTLYTNVPTLRVYNSLTPDQNAQLFLNSCNAFMPITDGVTDFRTSCAFAGINIHLKGVKGSNIVWKGKEIYEPEVTLDCGNACDQAILDIKNSFELQGGTWPIIVPKNQVSMPAEAEVVPTGKATKYCLEARYVDYTDVVFHILSGESAVNEGSCPEDPELGYPVAN